MRYDVRTGSMQPDEPVRPVPGWSLGDPRQHYDLRIGDAERDATMTLLREHFAAGRLTMDELTERIDGALAAKTQSQIDALLMDLPHIPSQRVPEAAESDAGRYVVLLLLLFALATWLIAMLYIASAGRPT